MLNRIQQILKKEPVCCGGGGGVIAPKSRENHQQQLSLQSSMNDSESFYEAMSISSGSSSSCNSSCNSNDTITCVHRPRFISVSFFKRDSDSWGIFLAQDHNNDIYVSRKSKRATSGGGEGYVLHKSSLSVGDKIISVNGKSCSGMVKSQLIDELRKSVGWVTIVAMHVGGEPNLVECTVEKKISGDREAGAGVVIERDHHGRLEISSVDTDGLFANSILARTDKILSINSVDCHNERPACAQKRICKSFRYATIVAEIQNVQESSSPMRQSIAMEMNVEFLDQGPLSRRFGRRGSICLAQSTKRQSVYPGQSSQDIFDVYGCRAQCVETEEEVTQALHDMEREIQRIPYNDKRCLVHAKMRCPELFLPSFLLQFLRCDCFHAKRAASRCASYWEQRVKIFGPVEAFKPITINNALKRDDCAYLRSGALNLLKVDGRNTLVLIPDRGSITSIESGLRAFWYFLHACLEHDDIQKKGLVVIVSLKYLSTYMKTSFVKRISATLRGCMPIRMSAYHMCYPSFLASSVYSVVSFSLPERLRRRLWLHSGTDEEVLKKLEGFGINRSDLPKEIGGGRVILDSNAWFWNRRAFGL